MQNRRTVLQFGGAAMLSPASAFARDAFAQGHSGHSPASRSSNKSPDYRIDIGTSVVELGNDAAVSTKTYNGQFPGPLLRLTQGKRVTVEIHNNTETPEQPHWHGQFLGPEIDGAAEEGTPFIPARGMRTVSFTPGPAGFRFYHTHVTAGADLSLGLYNGQAGLVYT